MPSVYPEREPDEHRRASGKPLTGAAAESVRRGKERREAEAAAARAIAPLARLMIRQAGGIDALRGREGRETALELAALAGLDTERLAGEWSRADPVRRQVSVASGDAEGYHRDPRHDPEVVKAIMAGAPHAEVNAAIKAATDRLLANPPKIIGPPGSYKDEAPDSGTELGVSYATARGADGLPRRVPVQRSTGGNAPGMEWDAQNHVLRPVNAPDPWEKLHAQDALARNYGLAGSQPQPSVTECDHRGPGPYCTRCGARTLQQPAEARP